MRHWQKISNDAIYSPYNKTYSANDFKKFIFNSDNSEFPQKKLQILFRTKILIRSKPTTTSLDVKSNQVS